MTAMCHLHGWSIRISINGDNLNTKTLKLDHHFLTQFTAAQHHHLGGIPGQRSAQMVYVVLTHRMGSTVWFALYASICGGNRSRLRDRSGFEASSVLYIMGGPRANAGGLFIG